MTSYVGSGLISKIIDTTRTIYHADGIGSTRAMTDSDQAVTMACIYDAYGNLLAEYPGSSAQSFGYAGQSRYYADSTGLDYLKARYYDPGTGRFISRDPIGYAGGLNLYEYTYGNPVRLVDPSGEVAPLVWVGAGVVVAGTAVYASFDWHTGALTSREKRIANYQIWLLKECAKEAGRPDLVRDLGKLRVYGKFEKGANREGDDVSITHDPLLRRRHTILSADYFHRNYGGPYGQLRTLLDETYHSAYGDFSENDNDYNYAEAALEALMPGLEKRRKCNR